MLERRPSRPPLAHSADEISAAPEPPGFPAAPTGSPTWPPALSRPSRWPTLVVLVVALIGVGVGIAAWFRPVPHISSPTAPPTPTYTEQEISDAKARACAAVDLVQKGVRLQTGASNPAPEPGNDPAVIDAEAANARLSMVAGASYMRDHLDAAIPPQIADTMRHLSDVLSDIATNYLAGVRSNDSQIAHLRSDSASAAARLNELCK
jgi:hypothetical protein